MGTRLSDTFTNNANAPTNNAAFNFSPIVILPKFSFSDSNCSFRLSIILLDSPSPVATLSSGDSDCFMSCSLSSSFCKPNASFD